MMFTGFWRTPLRRPLAPAAFVLALTLAGFGGGPRLANAQASDALRRDLRIVAEAFQVVADDASRGAWAQADEAYNAALDRLDAVREPTNGLGPVGVGAIEQIDAQLPGLESALAAEDVARTRTVIGLIQAQIALLVPGLPRTISPPQVVELLLSWQSQVQAIGTLAEAGAWRDMRNAAIALADAADGGRARLARDLGPAADQGAARIALLALRLRAAALSQSRAEATPAAEAASMAIRDLLTLSGALPTPTAPAPAGAFQFVAGHGGGAVGQPVTITLSAVDIPAAGLGGFEVRLRWSPGALRLENVSWRPVVGQGSVLRNDSLGNVQLRLPRAPRGPRGRAELADLRFTVRSATVQSTAYLPAGELEELQGAMQEAARWIRVADLPKASDALAFPYYRLLTGRGREDSLYHELDRFGFALPLEAALFNALDLTTRAAGTDLAVVALEDLNQAHDAALKGYMARLSELPGIPVDIVVVSAEDTTGAPLRAAESEPGLVLVPGTQIVFGDTATGEPRPPAAAGSPTAMSSDSEATIAAISALAASTLEAGGTGSAAAPSGGSPASADTGSESASAAGSTGTAEALAPSARSTATRRSTGSPGPPAFPRALVITLLGAFILGVVAVLYSSREP